METGRVKQKTEVDFENNIWFRNKEKWIGYQKTGFGF